MHIQELVKLRAIVEVMRSKMSNLEATMEETRGNSQMTNLYLQQLLLTLGVGGVAPVSSSSTSQVDKEKRNKASTPTHQRSRASTSIRSSSSSGENNSLSQVEDISAIMREISGAAMTKTPIISFFKWYYYNLGDLYLRQMNNYERNSPVKKTFSLVKISVTILITFLPENTVIKKPPSDREDKARWTTELRLLAERA